MFKKTIKRYLAEKRDIAIFILEANLNLKKDTGHFFFFCLVSISILSSLDKVGCCGPDYNKILLSSVLTGCYRPAGFVWREAALHLSTMQIWIVSY